MSVFEQALDLWGPQSQAVMCMEECAELIQALSKYLRTGVIGLPLMDEMVDVQIMLEQMKLLVPAEEYQSCYEFKLRRLSARLNESQKRGEVNADSTA
jgi:hypothetical protein